MTKQFPVGLLRECELKLLPYELWLAFTRGSISLSLLLSWPLFELHLSKMQNSAGTLVHAHLLFLCEAQHINSLLFGKQMQVSFSTGSKALFMGNRQWG